MPIELNLRGKRPLKSFFGRVVSRPSETQINAKMEVYAVYENGSLLALSTDLAAASTLQGELPNTDLLVVEIDDTVWNELEKRTEETIDGLTR